MEDIEDMFKNEDGANDRVSSTKGKIFKKVK